MRQGLSYRLGTLQQRRIAVLGVALFALLCGAASAFVLTPSVRVVWLWPLAGLLFVVLLPSPWRDWPALLGGALAAGAIGQALLGRADPAAAGLVLASCGSAALAAAVLRWQGSAPPRLHTLRQLAELVGWGVLGCNALSAALAAPLVARLSGLGFGAAWLSWWLGSGLAMLTAAACLSAWATPAPAARGWPRWAEGLLISAGVLGLVYGATGSAAAAPVSPFIIAPLLLWALLRLGPRPTSALILGVSLGVVCKAALRPAFTLPGLWPELSLLWSIDTPMLLVAAIVREQQQTKRASARMEARMAADKAELIRANQRLQQQIRDAEQAELLFSTVLQQLPVGVSIVEADSAQVIRRNEEAVRLIGQNPTDGIDSGPISFFRADGSPYLPEDYPLIRALAHRIVVRQEPMIMRRPDGSQLSLLVNAAPIFDSRGRLIAAVGMFHDVSSVRAMESTLNQSQAQFASVIESAMDAIIATDAHERITIWNAAAEQMFGTPASAALGSSIAQFIPERFRHAHHQHIQTFGRTGVSSRTMGSQRPLAARRASGEEFPIEASISQIAVEGQKFYTVILRDITARVRAEEALRVSEERFSKAFHISPTATVISSLADGRIIDVNDGFLKMFDRTREQVVGHSSLLLEMWENPSDRVAAVERLRRDGAVREMELQVRAAGNSLRDVLLSADMLTLESRPCIITTLYDISERKQAEQALQKSRHQLQAILDHAPALISLKHPNGDYLLVNQRFGTLFQRAPETIIGRSDAELFPPPLAAVFQANDQAVLTRGRPVELEEIMPLLDGPHTYSSIKFPLLDQMGQPYALCSIATDITERKLLEAQLFQAQKMDSIGQLAGGVAHDFNNLLTAITGYSELVMNSLPDDNGARDDMQQVLNAAQRATTLTRQLLAFARRQPIMPYVINLNTLVGDLDKLLRRLISEDIELEVRLAQNLHNVKADPAQIEQVLLNLVVNARDAMPQGGQLIVETGNVALDPRYANGHLDIPAGSYVMLAVTDTGTGMPPEVQAHVFEPFFTTKEPGKGTGLGLSTCYGIVKQHGGTIWIYSELGEGTSIKIYLPQAGGVPYLAQPQGEAQIRGGAETVLLVEDEDAVRVLAARVLRSHGYTVLEAINGVEAVRLARGYQPLPIHMLLTDVVMPQMSGRAVAEEIVALYPNIGTLYMSGYTEHATLRSSRIEPGSTFLQKPFTSSALAEAVRRVLDTL